MYVCACVHSFQQTQQSADRFLANYAERLHCVANTLVPPIHTPAAPIHWYDLFASSSSIIRPKKIAQNVKETADVELDAQNVGACTANRSRSHS